MITVGKGERRGLEIRNNDVKALRLMYTLNQTGGAWTAASIDWDAVSLNVRLTQYGKDVTIFSGAVKPWLYESSLLNTQFETLNAKVCDYTATVRKIGVDLDFGTVLNLRGTDLLYVEIKLNSVFAGANVDANTSYVSLEEVKGIGVQSEIPVINVKAIPAATNRDVWSIGDNCKSLAFIACTSEGATTSADEILQTVFVESDRLSFTKTFDSLLAERIDMCSTYDLHLVRGGNFQITSEETDRMKVEVTLDSTKVTTNTCFLVARTFIVTPRMAENMVKRVNKHAKYAVNKIGLNN